MASGNDFLLLYLLMGDGLEINFEDTADCIARSLVQEIINDNYSPRFNIGFLNLDTSTMEDFKEIILQNNLSTIFLSFIRKNNLFSIIDKDFNEKCNFQKNRFQIHSLEIIKEVHKLNDIFKKNELNPMFLKGIPIQCEYKDVTLRPLIDIDILFKKSEVLRAYELLHRKDFLNVSEKKYLNKKNFVHFCNNSHHIQLLTKNNIAIELHHRITRPRDFFECPITSCMYENSRSIEYYGKKINVPSIEDMIIHQLSHFSIQSDFNKLLRTLNDIKKIIDNNNINWHKIISKYKNKKIRKGICLSLELLDLNKVIIEDLDRAKVSFAEYFPEKNILQEAQKKLFGIKKRERGEIYYEYSLSADYSKKTFSRIMLPSKNWLIYKYKIAKPGLHIILLAYMRHYYHLSSKILDLVFFITKNNFSSKFVKYENSITLWLNKG